MGIILPYADRQSHHAYIPPKHGEYFSSNYFDEEFTSKVLAKTPSSAGHLCVPAERARPPEVGLLLHPRGTHPMHREVHPEARARKARQAGQTGELPSPGEYWDDIAGILDIDLFDENRRIIILIVYLSVNNFSIHF